MPNYQNESLKKYLDDLAAKVPAPGGGSAAALAGALGCALLSMVCNYTVGKERYKDVEAKVKKILRETERIRKRLLVLADADVRAYYKVFLSRKGAKMRYQKNLIAAAGVPLEICSLSARAFAFCAILARKGNKYLVSDVYVGKELLKSCFKSGALNVKINLPLIKDKKFTAAASRALKKLKKEFS